MSENRSTDSHPFARAHEPETVTTKLVEHVPGQSIAMAMLHCDRSPHIDRSEHVEALGPWCDCNACVHRRDREREAEASAAQLRAKGIETVLDESAGMPVEEYLASFGVNPAPHTRVEDAYEAPMTVAEVAIEREMARYREQLRSGANAIRDPAVAIDQAQARERALPPSPIYPPPRGVNRAELVLWLSIGLYALVMAWLVGGGQ